MWRQKPVLPGGRDKLRECVEDKFGRDNAVSEVVRIKAALTHMAVRDSSPQPVV